MNKLRIINYFEDLKSKVDLQVELYILDNRHYQAAVDEINSVREKWLQEIKDCEEFNISECVESGAKSSKNDDEFLFKRFCFLIEFNGDVLQTGRFIYRLISTDKYLRPGQIECFEVILKFTNLNTAPKNAFVHQYEQNLDRLFVTRDRHTFYERDLFGVNNFNEYVLYFFL
jgi:hypothetical protein